MQLLLYNMDPAMLREAVELVARRVPLEASGGVTLGTIRIFAETGVDFISVGRITQSLRLSMLASTTPTYSWTIPTYS